MNELAGLNIDYESVFDMKVEDIKSSVHATRGNLGKIKHFQHSKGADMSKVSVNSENSNSDEHYNSGHSPC